MKSNATDVAGYLRELPADRRDAIETVRATVLRHLPPGFDEGIEFGMISWHVPLARYPDTYNGRPLGVAALANQKRHMALYLTGVYGDPAEAEQGGDLGQDTPLRSGLLARVQNPAVELHGQVADGGFLQGEGMGIHLEEPAAECFLQGLHGPFGRGAHELDLHPDRAHLPLLVEQGRRQSEIDFG